MFNLADYKMENGKLQSFAWPGGYPIYYLCADNGVLCPDCANEHIDMLSDPDDRQWHVIAADANYEDDSLFCDHCSRQIESAYGAD